MESTIDLSAALKTVWDVVIIGGGPAGAFSAIKLSAYGLKILLLDKEQHPRAKVCGACINPFGVSMLEKNDLLPERGSTVQLKEAQIFSGGIPISFHLKGGLAIDRACFDAHLIESAAKRGTSVLFGFSAKLAGTSKNGARISLIAKGESFGELTAHVVVGAFGLSGLRSFEANLELAESEVGSYIGAGAIDVHGSHVPPGTIVMALGRRGYVGGVTLADGSLDTAAALSPEFVKSMRGIRPAVAAILREAGLSELLCSELDWKGTPLLSREGTVADERFFAVGDACGYVEPFTGEGITWALESAELAAPIIAQAAKAWDPAFISDWKKLYAHTLRRRKRLCRVVKTLLRTPPCLRDAALRAARFTPLSNTFGKLVRGEALSWI